MFIHSVTRAFAALSTLVAPVAAQSTLGAYAPAAAKYHMTGNQKTSQTMMGQAQEFETTTNQLLSLAVAKAGAALTLTMTLDSATVTTTAPTGVPDLSEAIGLKFVGAMGPGGVVDCTLAGDTVVAGTTAWKIVGVSATKITGTGNRMGSDYTISGDVKSTI